MPGIDQGVLAEIKARIDLPDLIAEYGVELRRQGANAKACCPFHKEKTPSFSVNGEKGFYKCFGCGEGGDAITFVQKMEGISFLEAARKLAERVGVKVEDRYDPQAKVRGRLYLINQELAAFYRRCLLQTREARRAREYLESRELMGEIAERFAIGYAPDSQGTLTEWAKRHGFTPDELVAAGVLAPPRTPGDRYYDRFHGRIVFPICDVQGRVVAFSCRLLVERKNTGKYVNSPETEIFKKAHTLYALHLARPNITRAVPRRAIVCEGQVDVIRCHACGFSTAVASQGTAFTAEHVELLRRYADAADLVFDGDKAGIKAALRTMGLFLAQGIPVRVVSLPPGEDPDSLLRSQGAEAFRACLDAAEDPAPYLVRRLREQEAAPDAMDAVMRVARAAVTTVLDCPEPVLTAKFLQDAADALRLPVSTLQSDLETLRADAAEADRRRAEWQARHVSEESARPSAPLLDERPAQTSFPVEEWEPEELPEYPEDVVEPPPVTAAFDPEAAQNLAGALCELLAHHFQEPEVMGCLLRHLPPAFVHNPYAAKLYDLAVAATLAKRSVLEPPKDDPAFTDYLARVFASPDRLLSAGDEVTPQMYARDLVRAYWLREYARRAAQLDPDSMEAFLLTQSRKRLQSLSWEAAEPFMDASRPFGASPVAVEAASPKQAVAPAPEEPPEHEGPLPEPEIWLPSDEDTGDVYDTL